MWRGCGGTGFHPRCWYELIQFQALSDLLAARGFCTKILQLISFWRKLAMVCPLNRWEFLFLLGCFLDFPSARYVVDFGVFENSEVRDPWTIHRFTKDPSLTLSTAVIVIFKAEFRLDYWLKAKRAQILHHAFWYFHEFSNFYRKTCTWKAMVRQSTSISHGNWTRLSPIAWTFCTPRPVSRSVCLSRELVHVPSGLE